MIDPEIERLFLRLDRPDTTWRDGPAAFADEETKELLKILNAEGQYEHVRTALRELAEQQVASVKAALEDLLGANLLRDTHVQDANYWTSLELHEPASADEPFGRILFGVVFSEFGNMVTVHAAGDEIDDALLQSAARILDDHHFVVIPLEQTAYPYSGANPYHSSPAPQQGEVHRVGPVGATWYWRYFDYW